MKKQVIWVSVIVLLAALTRLLPHPPNVTPVGAMALVAGAYLPSLPLAFMIPLTAMFISDLLIGFHAAMPFVYAAFIIGVLIGRTLQQWNWKRLLFSSLSFSILFFLITNFGVWVMYDYYPKSLQGLLLCYTAALPFFTYEALGTLFYSSVLFFGIAMLKQYVWDTQIR